jgi:hypothetical protein
VPFNLLCKLHVMLQKFALSRRQGTFKTEVVLFMRYLESLCFRSGFIELFNVPAEFSRHAFIPIVLSIGSYLAGVDIIDQFMTINV